MYSDSSGLPTDDKKYRSPWTCYEVGPDGHFKRIWQAPAWAGGWNYCSPAIYRDQVFVGVQASKPLADHFALTGARGKRGEWGGVVRLDLETGAVTGALSWGEINGGDARGIITSFAAGRDLVVLGDDKDHLHIFDAVGEEFRHLGAMETSFAAYAAPVIVVGHLFFREDNHVVCYGLR